MYSSSKLPWMRIHEYLLKIGNIREPKDFCVQAIKNIYSLIPYDQARVYFVNENGKIYDDFLIGVEKRWSDVYIEYYSRIETSRFSISKRLNNELSLNSNLEGGVLDWSDYEHNDEFITCYIKPQGLKFSAGSGFHSADNFIKSFYTLDRTSQSGYTRWEINIMSIIQSHLDNLHKNLFVLPTKNSSLIKNPAAQKLLTQRESEIAELLCKGLTPDKISNRLTISLPTVYKHMSNMHEKLDVSNRQELLLKLIDHSITG
ncbi:MAG: hypothetical protein JXA42_11095 [Anaerolineales bacterium]|nr:hypothetical protein [Anaerolineales bacterium]